jgi:hypothetical protein
MFCSRLSYSEAIVSCLCDEADSNAAERPRREWPLTPRDQTVIAPDASPQWVEGATFPRNQGRVSKAFGSDLGGGARTRFVASISLEGG